MIEIDRSKCKKMLVWYDDESQAVERIVICFDGERYLCVDYAYEDKFKEGGDYAIIAKWTNAKPLTELKPMTALDAMWWVARRPSIVIRDYCYNQKRVRTNAYIHSLDIIENLQWNELIRENGETKLKYSEWKQFNFDECYMGEG